MRTTMKRRPRNVGYIERGIRADLRMGPGGQAVIPEALCRELGFEEGAELIAYVGDNRLVLMTRDRLVAEIQAHFAHVPSGDSVVEEVILERREVARRQGEGDACWFGEHSE
jgi:hypothetical protein